MKILQIIDLYKTGGAEKVYDLFNQYCISSGYTIKRIVLYGKQNEHNTVECIINNEHISVFMKLYDQIVCIKSIYHILKEEGVDHIVSFLDRSNLVIIFACLFIKKRPKITVTIHNPPTIQYLKLSKYIRTFYFFCFIMGL